MRALLLTDAPAPLESACHAGGVSITRVRTPGEARALMGPSKLVGISCHSLADLLEAVAGGVDFVVLGPIFETSSKRPYGPPLGSGILREARALTSLPLVAIGGITPARTPEVVAAGADGVAAISAVMAAPDPAAAAAGLLAAVAASRRGD